MFGESLLTASYNDIQTYRYSAAFLIAVSFFLTFIGGYFSGQSNNWWFSFFAILIFWLFRSLIVPVKPNEFYEELVRHTVSLAFALLYFLFFLFGYFVAPMGAWWLSFSAIVFYFITLRIITKPHKP